jgi:hypothetical protein
MDAIYAVSNDKQGAKLIYCDLAHLNLLAMSLRSSVPVLPVDRSAYLTRRRSTRKL